MSLLERCREAKRSDSYPLADARGSEVNCNREVSEGNRDRQEAAFDLLGRARFQPCFKLCGTSNS